MGRLAILVVGSTGLQHAVEEGFRRVDALVVVFAVWWFVPWIRRCRNVL